jgi:hypothetical protein
VLTRTFQIVEHGQQLAQQILPRDTFCVRDFPTCSLSEVVKIRQCSQQLVFQSRNFGCA